MKEFMYNFIKNHYMLNRTPVSEDSDKVIDSIKRTLGCNVIEVASGTECLTWFIPKYWKVRSAYFARLDGRKIIDYHNSPLHLWLHSIPFQGEISREDLEGHLCYDKNKPDWIPYHYRNSYRFSAEEWGFCLPYNDYLKLKDDRYYVHIDTDLDTKGTMKIADCWIKGKHPETIFFAAHTCHPGQVTDGLSNVAVLISLFQHLRLCKDLNYSYRLILGPEYFAAAGFLSAVPQSEITLLKGGIYLDFIGNNQPFAYQTSFQADSLLDRVIANIFEHHVPYSTRNSYRELCGNDETFYNGPGFLIPTPSIICKIHPEYHFNSDNLDIVNINQLQFAVDIIKEIINIIETDYIPVPMFKGPIYLSRYNLYIDPQVDRKGYDNLEHIQLLIDGEHSCLEIAYELGIDYYCVKKFCDALSEKSLIEIEFAHSLNKNKGCA
ncbi:MAG: DUF4910 domain-containing protein [Desulfobacterales bacterium]|nr:DUF4910 domain-containing protein [Desulfobacterales bacterium]